MAACFSSHVLLPVFLRNYMSILSNSVEKRTLTSCCRSTFYKNNAYWFCNSKKSRKNLKVTLTQNSKRQHASASFAKTNLKEGPTLKEFIAKSTVGESQLKEESIIDNVSYLHDSDFVGSGRKVYFEVYGCQMNTNDTEIAWSLLQEKGFKKTNNIKEADVVLLMTCAIRDNAEQKIWNKLDYLTSLKKARSRGTSNPPIKIGILGCMAERLKEEIVERNKLVDVVCGPDAYRDLPRLLSTTNSGQAAINVILSLDETYADVMPLRINNTTKSAYISIMRGCDNMCTYCIVPFTRGRERSRPISSILEEVQSLSDQGIKQVTLLGQNVNSYRDTSEGVDHAMYDERTLQETQMSRGFKTVYKLKKGGRRFSDLLHRVALIDPEMRVRFTSPHPKDFPDEVLHLINEYANICNQIHLPAQSGSTQVLQAMRRGYTRQSYLELVDHIRAIIPDINFSSDFIAGFCGETESDHEDTVSLIKQVKYNVCYTYPYSMRQKTKAYHRLTDDVAHDVKCRRVTDLVNAFRKEAVKLNRAQIGQQQLILIEGESKRSQEELAGRNDGNIKVIMPNGLIPSTSTGRYNNRGMQVGDYVVAQINDGNSQVLKATPLFHSTLQDFHQQQRRQQEDIAS